MTQICNTCGLKYEGRPPETCGSIKHIKHYKDKQNWWISHPNYGKKYHKQRAKAISFAYQDKRQQLFGILGKVCACGFSDPRAMEFDHIDNDGAEELKKYGSYHKMITFYAEHPEITRKKIQTMCANCNRIKRYNHFIASGKWLADYYSEQNE